ncbi:MAG: hypothetical protein QM765_35440 [Myxococcales bacterium]
MAVSVGAGRELAEQPQTMATQTRGNAQSPQLASGLEWPQLSNAVTGPQTFPSRWQNATSVSGTQLTSPQTLAVPPPPQVSGAVQLPQLALRGLPQVSVPEKLTQLLPWRAQNAVSVSGRQVQTPLLHV